MKAPGGGWSRPTKIAAAVALVSVLAVVGAMARTALVGGFRDDAYGRYATGGYYSGHRPAPSPDGKWIAYSSPRTGRGDIYVVPTDGHAPPWRLVGSADCETSPIFSPDGRAVWYLRQTPDGWRCRDQVWRVEIASGKATLVYEAPSEVRSLCGGGGAGDLLVAFAPPPFTKGSFDDRGRRRRHGTERVETATGVVRVLTHEALPGLRASADGKRIVFNRPNLTNSSDPRPYIWAGDARLRSPRRIGRGWSPAPSRDGGKVAFLSEPYSQTLWVMDADGSHARRLYRNGRHFLSDPAFLPDGRRVVFHEQGNGREGRLMVAALDGSGARALTETD